MAARAWPRTAGARSQAVERWSQTVGSMASDRRNTVSVRGTALNRERGMASGRGLTAPGKRRRSLGRWKIASPLRRWGRSLQNATARPCPPSKGYIAPLPTVDSPAKPPFTVFWSAEKAAVSTCRSAENNRLRPRHASTQQWERNGYKGGSLGLYRRRIPPSIKRPTGAVPPISPIKGNVRVKVQQAGRRKRRPAQDAKPAWAVEITTAGLLSASSKAARQPAQCPLVAGGDPGDVAAWIPLQHAPVGVVQPPLQLFTEGAGTVPHRGQPRHSGVLLPLP